MCFLFLSLYIFFRQSFTNKTQTTSSYKTSCFSSAAAVMAKTSLTSVLHPPSGSLFILLLWQKSHCIFSRNSLKKLRFMIYFRYNFSRLAQKKKQQISQTFILFYSIMSFYSDSLSPLGVWSAKVSWLAQRPNFYFFAFCGWLMCRRVLTKMKLFNGQNFTWYRSEILKNPIDLWRFITF